MSPSGFPLLQVINAEGTVSIILVCPAIALNTLLLPTVVPNAVHDGSIIVVRLVQPSKQLFPAVVNDEKSGLVRLVQPRKQAYPAVVNDEKSELVRLVQPSKQSFPAVVNDEKSGLVRLVH